MSQEALIASIAEKLEEHLPENTARGIASHLAKNGALLKIKRPRKTKYGDYRPHPDGVHHIITINVDLNQFAFLITLVHELAHMYQYKTYGRKVKPHGEEWKSYFKQLMQPYLQNEVFPFGVQSALTAYMQNPKASSCVDQSLQEALRVHDPVKEGVTTVSELTPPQQFEWGQGRVFKLEGKMRKRFKCVEVSTGRAFAFSPLTEVKPL